MRCATTVLGLVLLTSSSSARTWRVEVDGSGDAPTIRAALDSATSGDIVDVGPGTYHEHLFMTGGRDILLQGRFGAESTVIDGDGSGTVVQMDAGTLEGFTIRNGGYGGIYVGQADVATNPTIRHNIIENNRAAVEPDCCIGGGVYSIAYGTRIEWNMIRNNSVFGAGGGIWSTGEQSVIAHNMVAFNWAQYNTGGILATFASVTDNLIVGNYATYANGGADIEGGEFRNNTVYGNETRNAFPNAAGVRVHDTETEANIIVRNRGGTVGIGLVVDGGLVPRCNDVWGNDIDAISGPQDPSNFSADPLFCAADPLTSLNFLLRSNSPCAPGNSPGGQCGLIGDFPVGCGTVAVQQWTWGEVKRLFR